MYPSLLYLIYSLLTSSLDSCLKLAYFPDVPGGGVTGDTEITHIDKNDSIIGFIGRQYNSDRSSFQTFYGYYILSSKISNQRYIKISNSDPNVVGMCTSSYIYMNLLTENLEFILIDLPTKTVKFAIHITNGHSVKPTFA